MTKRCGTHLICAGSDLSPASSSRSHMDLVNVRRVRAMGIRDRPTSFRSPWQNGYVERLIGSVRQECLDHLIVFNAEHLRRILTRYATYYNEVRTHVWKGRARHTSDRALGRYCCVSDPGRATPSIRANLTFRKRHAFLAARRLMVSLGRINKHI